MNDIRDFYIKNSENSKYKDGEIIIQKEIELIINKIEMILFTNPGDVLSDINFGLGLEKYLWSTNVSTEYIQNDIQNQFNNYIPELQKYTHSIDLQMMEGTIQDILVINIIINDINITVVFK